MLEQKEEEKEVRVQEAGDSNVSSELTRPLNRTEARGG